MTSDGARQGDEAWVLAGLVARLRRALRSSVRSEIAWERLPMAQVELLQRLADEPGLRVGELASRQRLATNTVSALVQQMVLAGLLERSADPRDRRALTVVPTEEGLAALRSWLEANGRRIESALVGLDQHDRRSITAALPALARLVDRLEAGAGG